MSESRPWPGRTPPPLVIWAVTLTGITANTLIAPVLPDILDDFAMDDSAAGLLVASASIPGVLVAPMIGIAADRWGRRRVLLPCLLIFGAMGIVGSLAPNYWTLVVSRLVMGIGTAGLINLAVVIIGDHYDGEERIRQVGRNAAVLTAGLALLPMLSGSLEGLGGWRLSLLPSSLSLITAVAVWFTVEDSKPPGLPHGLSRQLSDAVAVLRTPAIRATVVSGFLIFVMIFGLFLTTLPVHLEREFSLSAAPRGLLLGIPSISSTLIALNLARLRRLIGLRRLLIAGAVMFGVSLLMVGLAPTLIAVVVGLLIYGGAEGATVPSLQETTVARAPADQRGVVLAVWVSAVRLGQALGPLLFASLFAAIGTGRTLVAGSAVAIAVLVIHARSAIGDPVVEEVAADAPD